MVNMLLRIINALRVIIILCFFMEVLIIVGGSLFNVLNPAIKGFGRKDFIYTFIAMAITVAVFLFITYSKNKIHIKKH